MGENLKFLIPGAIPPELNPNWQYHGPGHNGIKARAIKEMKEQAYYYAINARNTYFWDTLGKPWEPLDKATIQVTVILGPRGRKWDETNFRAAFKPAEDAIVQAEIIVDDSPEHLTWLPVLWEKGEAAGMLVEVKELE